MRLRTATLLSMHRVIPNDHPAVGYLLDTAANRAVADNRLRDQLWVTPNNLTADQLLEFIRTVDVDLPQVHMVAALASGASYEVLRDVLSDDHTWMCLMAAAPDFPTSFIWNNTRLTWDQVRELSDGLPGGYVAKGGLLSVVQWDEFGRFKHNDKDKCFVAAGLFDQVEDFAGRHVFEEPRLSMLFNQLGLKDYDWAHQDAADFCAHVEKAAFGQNVFPNRPETRLLYEDLYDMDLTHMYAAEWAADTADQYDATLTTWRTMPGEIREYLLGDDAWVHIREDNPHMLGIMVADEALFWFPDQEPLRWAALIEMLAADAGGITIREAVETAAEL